MKGKLKLIPIENPVERMKVVVEGKIGYITILKDYYFIIHSKIVNPEDDNMPFFIMHSSKNCNVTPELQQIVVEYERGPKGGQCAVYEKDEKFQYQISLCNEYWEYALKHINEEVEFERIHGMAKLNKRVGTEPFGWVFKGKFFKDENDMRGMTMHEGNVPTPVYAQEQLQLNKQVGAGVWIAASERLPDKEGIYIVKRYFSEQSEKAEYTGSVFTNYEGYVVKEWLDETPTQPISLSDDEIEKMAEKEYPDEQLFEGNERVVYLANSNIEASNQMQQHRRNAYITGAKAISAALQQKSADNNKVL